VRTAPLTATLDVRSPVLWVLGAALIVRLLLLVGASDLRLLMDENQYQEIAVNLVEGRGFAIYDKPTSWRPPLYPFLLSVIYRVGGTTDPMAARAVQAALSLVMLALVYQVARRLFEPRAAVAATAVVAFYPSLLFYNNHLLTEVLFTTLLTLIAYCLVRYLESAHAAWLAGAGLALALTVLTREILWPMLGVMVLLAGHVTRWRPAAWGRHALGVVAAFLVVVTPWVVRNTMLQGTFTFIATNGGVVFYEGNYEHTPLDRPWRAHTLDDDIKVRRLLPQGLTEGERQKVAMERGIAFMKENPGLTIRRSLVKMANVWGLEREVVGLVLAGEYGALGRAGALVVSGAIFSVYVVTMLAGVVGLSFAIGARGPWMVFHLFFAVLVGFVTLAHAPAFGHPRFHLPLMPLFAVYAAYAWSIRSAIRRALRGRAFMVAMALAGLLAIVWVREIALESERFIQGLLRL
jgi:4-amino-4-deoxy-L-arabinose transferase-like glycosyltransferase